MRILKPASSREQNDSHRRRACAFLSGFTAALFVSLTIIPTASAKDSMSAQEIMQRKDVGVAVITVFDPRPEEKSSDAANLPQNTADAQVLLSRQPKVGR